MSFLKYADFEEQGRPELRHSVRVFLPRAAYTIRDYSASTNPPILHRKETLVDVLHPSYSIFSELTLEEETKGLLSRSNIGMRQAWLELLAANNMTIIGHRLSSIVEPD